MSIRSLSKEQSSQLQAYNQEREKESSGNVVVDFASGIGEGLREDPFISFGLKALAKLDGVDPNGLEEIRQKTKNSNAAQFGRFIGEFGPSLLLGVGSYGAGFLAGRAAIQQIAKQVALKDAARTALQGIGRGVTRNELSAGALVPKRGFLKRSLEQTRRKAGDLPGVPSQIQGTPIVQAAAERGGAATGIGGFVTSQELARGKSPTEALQTGALAAALSVGVDTTLVGGARVLFRGSRTVDLQALRDKFRASGGPEKFKKLATAETGKIAEMTQKLKETLRIDDQQLELRLLGGPTRAERSREILKTPEAQDLVRQIRASKTRREAIDFARKNEGLVPYVHDTPGGYLVSPGRLLTDTPLSKLFAAPEALIGTEGVAANKYLSTLKNILIKSEGEERKAQVLWSDWSNRVRKAATGSSNPIKELKSVQEWKRGLKKGKDGSLIPSKNLLLAHEWEREGGGPNAVKELMKKWGRTDEQAEEVISIFREREAWEWKLYQVKGKKIGGKPPVDLAQAKVGKWLPHSSKDWTETDLVKFMKDNSNLTDAEIHQIMRGRGSHLDPEMVDLQGVRVNNPARNGPLEFDRVETGTTLDKIKRGIPLNPNVWDSGYQTSRAAIRRINTDPILGGAVNTEKGRILGGTVDDMVALVEAEGGNGVRFRAVVDSLAGHSYYNESMRKWATAFTAIETAAKLPMAVLANATQPVLTATWLGYKNALRGGMVLTNKTEREILTQAMAVHQHIGRAIGRSMDDEGLALTGLEKVADWMLRFTGFSSVERFNRIHGAAATQVMIRDRLSRGAFGNLRGTRLDTTKKMFADIGLDYDGLVRQLRASKGDTNAFFNSPAFQDLELNAMLQGAQKTQFFPGATRTPPLWNHPLARTVLQFKTFATGQTRLMRDAVLTEYSNGNPLPLATYLSAAPLAGEFVGSTRAFIKGKERTDDGVDRGLRNLAYIGGLGIVTDFWSLANWGKLESFILGPTISDLTQATEFLLTGEMGQLRKMGQRQPAFQLVDFLMGTFGEGIEGAVGYLDSIGSDSGSTTVDIGERLTERIRSKR